eukprot:TRINITY_DN9724_c0_g1_i1.p2 TRINITY_DN9724_c0_g1~~TRINITY_DN9724_c0_g1_i1.p2  ORF type:complete len:207 (+),score=52.84 TRINITY_DN9724_c0_g1_i1:241-861(+)
MKKTKNVSNHNRDIQEEQQRGKQMEVEEPRHIIPQHSVFFSFSHHNFPILVRMSSSSSTSSSSSSSSTGDKEYKEEINLAVSYGQPKTKSTLWMVFYPFGNIVGIDLVPDSTKAIIRFKHESAVAEVFDKYGTQMEFDDGDVGYLYIDSKLKPGDADEEEIQTVIALKTTVSAKPLECMKALSKVGIVNSIRINKEHNDLVYIGCT